MEGLGFAVRLLAARPGLIDPELGASIAPRAGLAGRVIVGQHGLDSGVAGCELERSAGQDVEGGIALLKVAYRLRDAEVIVIP